MVKWEEVEEPTWHTIEELYDYESRDVIAEALEAMKEKEKTKKKEKEKQKPAAKKSEPKEITVCPTTMEWMRVVCSQSHG